MDEKIYARGTCIRWQFQCFWATHKTVLIVDNSSRTLLRKVPTILWHNISVVTLVLTDLFGLLEMISWNNKMSSKLNSNVKLSYELSCKKCHRLHVVGVSTSKCTECWRLIWKTGLLRICCLPSLAWRSACSITGRVIPTTCHKEVSKQ